MRKGSGTLRKKRKTKNMAEYVKVAVDAMGGDNAPGEIVKGAVEAVQAEKKIKVFLVGKQDQVEASIWIRFGMPLPCM